MVPVELLIEILRSMTKNLLYNELTRLGQPIVQKKNSHKFSL